MISEEQIPSQYKPLFDRYVIKIAEAVEGMMPIFNELGGEKLTIELGDIIMTMQSKDR